MGVTVASGPNYELRLGDWREVLTDVEADVMCVDAPYSEKTHTGHDGGIPDDGVREKRPWKRTSRPGVVEIPIARQTITYPAWTEDDVNAFVDHWGPRVRGWFCTITDHVLAPIWAGAMAMPENGDRYVFAPIPIVETGSRVRLTGDGPSSWTCYLVVGRPKREPFSRWGTLPGAYIGAGRGDREIIGGKDSAIMRAVVRDYSKPGDLIVDPCSGAATTGIAALMEGRRFIGSERDPKHFEIARKRLEALKYTAISRSLFEATSGEQMALGGEK